MYRNELYVESYDVSYWESQIKWTRNQWLKENQELPPGDVKHTQEYREQLVKIARELESEIADLESFAEELKGILYDNTKEMKTIKDCEDEALEDLKLRKLYIQRMEELGKPVRK